MIMETLSLLGISLLFIIALGILWIYTLYRTIVKEQWVWLVINLISGIGFIIYWILVLNKKVK